MSFVGKVEEIAKTEFTRTFEWRIDDFFSLSEEDGKYYRSPNFLIDGEYWFLSIFPNGYSVCKTVGYIGVCFHRKLSGPSKSMAWKFSLKTVYGKKYCEQQGSHKFLKRSELIEKKSTLVPDGVLTIVFKTESCSKSTTYDADNPEKAKCPDCKEEFDAESFPSHKQKCLNKPIRCPTCNDVVELRNWFNHECPQLRAQDNPAKAKCSDCKEEFDAESLPSHKQKCLNKPIRCPTCSDVVELRNWFDHECPQLRAQGSCCISQPQFEMSVNNMLQDLKKLFLDQESCDVVIKVGEEEFKAHKLILMARSTVLASTFRNDMKEKATGIIDIKDCDSKCFSEFLNFLYCGKVENLSSENVFGLFKIADKYDVQDLRTICSEFVKKNLSLDTFCETLTLAVQHTEKELIDSAVHFFAKHIQEVIVRVDWQTFIVQNPIVANEVLIKALASNNK